MDGGLDAAGVAAAEAHASTCERCQELLATVVRTMPVSDETQMARGFSRGAPARLWKWWFAPLAATAAAVTIWMVVPQTPLQRSPTSEFAESMDAPAKAQPQAGPAEPFAPAPPPASTPPPAVRDSLADARRNVPASANEAKAKLADGRDTAKADADRKDASGFARDQSSEPRRDAQAKREENARASEMRQAVEAPSPAAATERMREVPAAPSVGAVTQLQKQVSTPTVVSPDPSSRWRVLAGGGIERSEDGGRVWIPVRLAQNEEVLAGASPGRLIAWMVGRNGLVLLATDGTNFTRLPFPESVDLVAVSSPDARIAMVTTADGRIFRTEDAGRNWRNP